MNIRHLKIFVIVYQNMSVTKAGKNPAYSAAGSYTINPGFRK